MWMISSSSALRMMWDGLSLRPEISAPHWQGRWKCRGGTRSPARAESLPHVAALPFNSIRPPSLRSSTNHPPCDVQKPEVFGKPDQLGPKITGPLHGLLSLGLMLRRHSLCPATRSEMRRDPSQKWTRSGSLDNKP